MTRKLEKKLLQGRDTKSQRRAILSMIPLLRQRGTPRGMVGSFFTYAGRETTYRSWFDLIVNLAESQLGQDFFVIGSSDTQLDEYVSELRLMDDGSLDEDQLIELVKLHRPSNEVLRVKLLDFYDEFSAETASLSRWRSYAATSASFADLIMTIPPGAHEDPIVPIKPWTSFSKTILFLKFCLQEAGDSITIWDCRDTDSTPGSEATAGAEIKVFCDPAGTGTTASIKPRPTAGTTTLPSSSAPFLIQPNAWYNATVLMQTELSGAISFDLRINHNPFLKVTDGGATYFAGKFALSANVANTKGVKVDSVIYSRLPARVARIDRNGVSASETFFTE
jgi:hypothetical protein